MNLKLFLTSLSLCARIPRTKSAKSLSKALSKVVLTADSAIRAILFFRKAPDRMQSGSLPSLHHQHPNISYTVKMHRAWQTSSNIEKKTILPLIIN